jgi:5-methylcytosine-specific restriction endonuclease McrA
MAQTTRACAVCGEDFASDYSFQKFCGAKCARKDRYARTREQSIAYSKQWIADNREKHGQYAATWRERNPEVAKEAARQWQLAHPEKGREAAKRWYAAHPEQARAMAKRVREATVEQRKERLRRWHEANPEASRLMGNKRRALRLGNRDSIGVRRPDWISLVRRYGGRCAYCGIRPDRIYMDHVIPLIKGGRDAIGNVLPTCFACNASKGPKLLAVWRYRCGGAARGGEAFHG